MDIGIGRWTPCRSNVTFLDVFASEKVNLTVGVVGIFYACFFEYRTDSDESSQKSAWIETEKQIRWKNMHHYRWWFEIFFGIFTPKIGEDEPNLTCAYLFKWVVWNHQLDHQRITELERHSLQLTSVEQKRSPSKPQWLGDRWKCPWNRMAASFKGRPVQWLSFREGSCCYIFFAWKKLT